MSLVVIVEVSVDGLECRRQHAPILALGQHIEIDRLKQSRIAFNRPVNDFLFPDLALPDDFGVRDAVCGPQCFLGGQIQVAFDVQPLARMTKRVNRPRRERLLVDRRPPRSTARRA